MTIHDAVNLPPKKPLSILHLEDNSSNAKLARSKLNSEKIACGLFRVESRVDFVAALKKGRFGLILADYMQPQTDGRAALEIASEIRPELPFIFLCDAARENAVIELLQAGATDYLLKPDLLRLAPLIRRAAHDAETRSELKRFKGVRKALRNIHLVIGPTRDVTMILRSRLDPADILLADFVNPSRARMQHRVTECIATGETPWLAITLRRENYFPFHDSAMNRRLRSCERDSRS